MNRRVLDNVSITALSKHGDEELTKSVTEMFGPGTYVVDAKTPIVSFDKSMLGLAPTNISNMIRKTSKEFMPKDNIGIIKDSKSTVHEVSKEAVAILKAVAFYRVTCNVDVSDCLGSILNEIDDYLTIGKSNDTVSVLIEQELDGEIKETNNKNLMEYCRKEVFGLLKEVGLNID